MAVIRLGINIADYRDDEIRNAFERLSELVVADESCSRVS